MIEFFLNFLPEKSPFLNLFSYLSTRTILATLTGLIIVIFCSVILYLFIKNLLNKNITIFLLTVVLLFDLWGVNKTYVNSDQFVSKSSVLSPFKKSISDEAILRDGSDFRVYESQRGFSNGRTSYFHKSISGYHAAKPKRIQNLYDFYIVNNNMKILSLLNVKYLIKNSEDNPLGVTRNPNNFGNAWFIKNTLVVDNADQELILLDSVDLSSTCLTQNSKLSNLKFTLNSKDSIKLISRKANELNYKSSTSSEQFAVFS